MRRLLWAGLLLNLVACATLPPPGSKRMPADWPARQAVLSSIKHFELSGRFGASNEEGAWQGSLQWRQQDGEYLITLSGPLGSGSMELRGDNGHATLRTADDAIYMAADADDLLLQHVGWDLPVSGLRYWLLGQPAPYNGGSEMEFDAAGRLQRLKQAGWNIQFRRYRQVNGIELPAKVFLDNPYFQVRLVVERWLLS